MRNRVLLLGGLKDMRRGFRWIVVVILIACTGKHPDRDPREIVVGISAIVPTLDPRVASDAYGMRIGNLIFSSLVNVGPNLEVVGESARSWKKNGNTYIFELAPGLKFHNGRAVKPDDLKYSYDQFRNHSVFASSFEIIEKFEVNELSDHLQVRLTLKEDPPNWILTDLPLLKILPKDEFSGEQLIGSGPYRLIESTEHQILLEAFANAWEPPRNPRVAFKVVRDDLTRFQKLLKGELDIVISDLAPDKVAALQKKPEQFQVYLYPGTSMTYILLNMKDPVISRLDVRKALSQSIDRAQLIKYKLKGLAREAMTIIPYNHPFLNKELTNPATDFKAAQQVAGTLKEGTVLAFKCSNNPSAFDHAKVIANQWGRGGFTVDLQSYEWGKFYSDIKAGNFQMALMKWVGVFDPDIYRMAFHSLEKPPGRNRGAYENPDLDQILNEVRITVDYEKRKKMYQRIQKILSDDYAILPLWYEEQVAVVRSDVAGFEPSQAGSYRPLLRVMRKTGNDEVR